jgi:hypothetical protein
MSFEPFMILLKDLIYQKLSNRYSGNFVLSLLKANIRLGDRTTA